VVKIRLGYDYDSGWYEGDECCNNEYEVPDEFVVRWRAARQVIADCEAYFDRHVRPEMDKIDMARALAEEKEAQKRRREARWTTSVHWPGASPIKILRDPGDNG
jgi:hypothetical protein